jgi:transcriptional regulator with XRE-family HTH domain
MQYSNIGSLVRQFLNLEGISQQELAGRAGISQSTVSRALAGRPETRSVARRKLFNYMQGRATEWMPEAVSVALRRVWDGSDIHAEALARIIEATEDLRPISGDGSKASGT